MRNLETSARTIASAVAAAERASSLALQEAGRLLTAVTTAHLESDLAIECDHEIVEHVSQGIVAQVSARGALVAMHRRQAALARRLNVVVSEGNCPPPPHMEKPQLGLVSAAA